MASNRGNRSRVCAEDRGVSRRAFLAAAAAATGAIALRQNPGCSAALADPRVDRPNIVLIVTDDQRAESLGCAGNSIVQTPNIDALAQQGVRFTQSFATTAICMSSRASLLTGLYSCVHGIENFATPLPRPLFENSYPMLLRKAGYQTGFVGKWGISAPLPNADYDFFQGYAGQGYYVEPGNNKHLTTRQADQAIAFLQTCKSDQPFCLAVSFKAPHVQDEGRTEPGMYAKYPFDVALKDVYRNNKIPAVRTIDRAPLPRFFESIAEPYARSARFSAANYQDTMKDLYRLISGVDLAVGRITAALRERGFDRNTVVIYTSDHGSLYGEHGLGGKWLMYEESIRTPLIVADPRQPRLHGSTREQMALNIDIAPTLLELTFIPVPIGMQGRSLLPLMQSQPPAGRGEWFYENHFRSTPASPIAASEGVRTREWKYIRYIDTDPIFEQLFNLTDDPREERNLAEDPAGAVHLNHLRQRWKTWRAATVGHRIDQAWVDPA